MEEEGKNMMGEKRHLVRGAVWGGVVGLLPSLFCLLLQAPWVIRISYSLFVLLFFAILGSVVGYLKSYKSRMGSIFRGSLWGFIIGLAPLIILAESSWANTRLMILSIFFTLLFFIVLGGIAGYLKYYSSGTSFILGIIGGIIFGILIFIVPELIYIAYPFIYIDNLFRVAVGCEECWFIGISFWVYYIFFWALFGISLSTLLRKIRTK